MKSKLISFFLTFGFIITVFSCVGVPTKISYKKKEDMPEYYNQYYPFVEKHFKKAEDSVYIYLRGSCFKDDLVIIEETDTNRFKYENYSYGSRVKIYPKTKKAIHLKFKGYRFKIKTNSEYFYTHVCFSYDTLRINYYNYPFVDIIK